MTRRVLAAIPRRRNSGSLFARCIDFGKDGDPELEPVVENAERRLERLKRTGS